MKFHPNSIADRKPIYEQIVVALANDEGVDPTDLEPLYETVDPEALDDLFKPGVEGKIEFTYAGHEVAVHSDGTVYLDESAVDVGNTRPTGQRDDTSEVGTAE